MWGFKILSQFLSQWASLCPNVGLLAGETTPIDPCLLARSKQNDKLSDGYGSAYSLPESIVKSTCHWSTSCGCTAQPLLDVSKLKISMPPEGMATFCNT